MRRLQSLESAEQHVVLGVGDLRPRLYVIEVSMPVKLGTQFLGKPLRMGGVQGRGIEFQLVVHGGDGFRGYVFDVAQIWANMNNNASPAPERGSRA